MSAKVRKNRSAKFGSVSVVERNGYIRVRWRENKRTVERSKTDWSDACDFARQVDVRIASGGVGAPDGTFAGLADAAMSRDRFPSWSDEAYENLRSILRNHIVPAIGSKKARNVSEDDCVSILVDLNDEGYSKHTVSKARKILRIVGKFGVKNGVWVSGQEPTAELKMPSSTTESMNVQIAPIELWRIPTNDQADAFVNAAWAHSGRAGFICEMARTCGLRWSEIRGLTPECFDFDERVVSVFKTRKKDKAQKTKTLSGQRRVIIRKDRVDVLREYVSMFSARQYLVETKSGRPIANSNWAKVMDKLREESGYPEHMALHSLRHYCASRWRREGVSVEDVSKLLGHSNVATTATLYLHSDQDYLNRIRDII